MGARGTPEDTPSTRFGTVRPPGSNSSSPWLYIQSEALQDIPFHLHPGPSLPPRLAKSPVLGRCGKADHPSRRVQNLAVAAFAAAVGIVVGFVPSVAPRSARS